MKFANAASTAATFPDALREAVAGLRADLDGAAPHVVFAFASPHHGLHFDALPAAVSEAFPGACVVGCSGGGVVGGGHEVEGSAGLSLTAAVLPDVGVTPFAIAADTWSEPVEAADLREAVGVDADLRPTLLVFADPHSTPGQRLVRALDAAYPDGTILGGIASGGGEAGQNALFLGDRALHRGVVGVALYGGLEVDTIVAQGCRPVGDVFRVTDVAEHVLLGLDDDRAYDRLKGVFDALDPQTRFLFQRAPMVGVAADPQADRLLHGDFLLRQVLGVDVRRGAVAIGHHAEAGDRVRFHVRDRATSVQDLHDLAGRWSRGLRGERPAGALMFSCLGRGRGFYGEADVDHRIVDEHTGGVPVGGFFCNGEIGPVRGRTHLHGYTASIALFRPSIWS